MISPFAIRDRTSFEIVFPVLNHINIAPNYFRIYSEPKVIEMLMLEELIGALSQIPLLLRHLIEGSYTLFGAHYFKVSEHVIERK